MTDVPVNAGLITVLGSEGYLTPKFDHVRQSQIYENVMYDTSEVVGYQGHQWTEIMDLFPSVYCYKLNLEEDDVDIRENLNLFYKLLCQIALDCDMENNPYTENLKSVWEKIFYEGTLAKFHYNNLHIFVAERKSESNLLIKIGKLFESKRKALGKQYKSREMFIEKRSDELFGSEDWISLRYLYNIEHGKNWISIEKLLILAKALEVDTVDLFAEIAAICSSTGN